MASIELRWSSYAKNNGLTGYYFILRQTLDKSDDELLSSTPIKVFDDLNTNYYVDEDVVEGENYKYCIGTVVGKTTRYGRIINTRAYKEKTGSSFGARLVYGSTEGGIGDTLTSSELAEVNSQLEMTGTRAQGFFSGNYHYIFGYIGYSELSTVLDAHDAYGTRASKIMKFANGYTYKILYETGEQINTETRGLKVVERFINYYDAITLGNALTSELLDKSYDYDDESYSYNTPNLACLIPGTETFIGRNHDSEDSGEYGFLLRTVDVI